MGLVVGKSIGVAQGEFAEGAGFSNSTKLADDAENSAPAGQAPRPQLRPSLVRTMEIPEVISKVMVSYLLPDRILGEPVCKELEKVAGAAV